MWLDEQIWGHRLWDGQDPVAHVPRILIRRRSLLYDGGLLKATTLFPFHLSPRPAYLSAQSPLQQREASGDRRRNIRTTSRLGGNGSPGCKTKPKAVPRSRLFLFEAIPDFPQFVMLIDMIRSSTIESSSNKRWSSRFIFPFGRHAIYEDLNIKDGSSSREYIYFTRNGELLYQMLSRSKHADALAEQFKIV